MTETTTKLAVGAGKAVPSTTPALAEARAAIEAAIVRIDTDIVSTEEKLKAARVAAGLTAFEARLSGDGAMVKTDKSVATLAEQLDALKRARSVAHAKLAEVEERERQQRLIEQAAGYDAKVVRLRKAVADADKAVAALKAAMAEIDDASNRVDGTTTTFQGVEGLAVLLSSLRRHQLSRLEDWPDKPFADAAAALELSLEEAASRLRQMAAHAIATARDQEAA